MTRGHEQRLEKLERTLRPEGEKVFLVWGRDEEAAHRALSESCKFGEVRKGDLAFCAVWPHADDLPLSRWVTFTQLSYRELGAILDMLKLRIGFCEETRGPCSPNPELLHMSTDDLFRCLGTVV